MDFTSSSSSVQSVKKGISSSRVLSSPNAMAIVLSLRMLLSRRSGYSFLSSSLQTQFQDEKARLGNLSRGLKALLVTSVAQELARKFV